MSTYWSFVHLLGPSHGHFCCCCCYSTCFLLCIGLLASLRVCFLACLLPFLSHPVLGACSFSVCTKKIMSEMGFCFLQAIFVLCFSSPGLEWDVYSSLVVMFLYLLFPYWFIYSFKVREAGLGLKGHQRLLPRTLSRKEGSVPGR